MGDSITEGEMGQWMYAVGDDVNMDDVVAEIETDKITTEVKAPCNGTITALLAEEGDGVKELSSFKLIIYEGGKSNC